MDLISLLPRIQYWPSLFLPRALEKGEEVPAQPLLTPGSADEHSMLYQFQVLANS